MEAEFRAARPSRHLPPKALTIPVEFFEAPEFPTGCLYTGRTDRVAVKKINVWTSNKGEKSRMTVLVPLAPLPWRIWLVRWHIAVVPGLLGMVFFWTQLNASAAVVMLAFGVAVGASQLSRLVDWLAKKWLLLQYVTLEGGKQPGEIVILFPGTQVDRFNQYSQAFAAWQERYRAENPGAVPVNRTLDWTAHPEARWQAAGDSGRGESVVGGEVGGGAVTEADRLNALRARWPDLPRQGPFELEVSVAFMNSRYLPHCCLFSGQTERVERKIEFMQRPVRPFAEPHLDAVAIPQAPNAKIWNDARRQLALLLLFVLNLPILFIAVFGDHSSDRSWLVLVLFASLFLGTGVAIATWVWARRTSVTCKLVEQSGVLRLSIPVRLGATYTPFREAWEEYSEAEKRGRLAAPADGEDPFQAAPDDEAESWADEKGGATAKDGWDEGKKK